MKKVKLARRAVHRIPLTLVEIVEGFFPTLLGLFLFRFDYLQIGRLGARLRDLEQRGSLTEKAARISNARVVVI